MSARFSDLVLVPSGKYNTENDPAVASLVTPAVQQRWLGILGRCWFVNADQALKNSDTSVGTLRAGWYAVVQVKSTASAAVARGQAAFFLNASDMSNFIVTTDAAAALDGRVAGVFINVITAGQYGIIQVGGDCTVKYRATVTDTTDGDLVVLKTGDVTFDALADAGTINTAGGIKGVKGVALEAPANGALKRAYLEPTWAWAFQG